MEKYPVIQKLNRGDRAMYAGLLAVSVTALSIVSTKEALDMPLRIAIFCFAASIPFLAFCTERVRIDAQYSSRTHSIGIDLAEGIGIFGCLAGLSAIFWHISVYATLVFAGSVFAANWLHVWYTGAMEKVNAEDDTKT